MADKKTVAVVVPTIRPEQFKEFLEAWAPLFTKHDVVLIAVEDGESPRLRVTNNGVPYYDDDFYKEHESVIFNYTDAVRNLGFLYVVRHLPDIEYIISLDDDVRPHGDTIQAHLWNLQMNVLQVPGWVSTMMDEPPRGLPYTDRVESPVMLSHGLWFGVADYDAPTQLLKGGHLLPGQFQEMVIPPGLFFPLCAMNFAIRRAMLPYIYQAPMGRKLAEYGLPVYDRFADIWGGVAAKAGADYEGWAVISGRAYVHHIRASSVWANIKKEAPGLELNEVFVQEFLNTKTTDPYVLFFKSKLEQWAGLC